MIKLFQQNKNSRELPHWIKNTYENSTAYIIFSNESNECFPMKIRKKVSILTLITPLQHYTEGSNQCNKARKEN